MTPTDRDLRLLGALRPHPFLPTARLRQLVFGETDRSGRRLRKRLATLAAAGYVRRRLVRLQRGPARAAVVAWTLTEDGLGLLTPNDENGSHAADR